MNKLLVAITCVLVSLGTFLAGRLEAHEFNWQNLTLAWIKLHKNYDFEANVNGYLQTFRQDVWQSNRGNEFALKRIREETLKIMKERVENFSLEEEFTLAPRLEIGKYDFTDKGFPILNMSSTHYWYEYGPYAQNFSTNMRVFFSNSELLQFVKMEGKRAEDFVARQGNGFNRSIYGKVKFKLVGKKGNEAGAMLAEIQSAILYEDPQRLKEITEIIKSKEKLVRKEKVTELSLKDKIVAVTSRLAITDPSKDGKRLKTFEIELEANKTYRIDAESEEFDSYLILQDATGKQIAYDDDSGGDRNARITQRIRDTGTYRIIVTSYGDGQTTGEFTLTVREKAK